MGLGDSSTVRQWWRGAARPKDPLAFARLVDIPVETVLGWG
jgi:DNA-binding transcriptional regulator YiaG